MHARRAYDVLTGRAVRAAVTCVRRSQQLRSVWVQLMIESDDWELVELCHEGGLPWHPWAATALISESGCFGDDFAKLQWMHAAGCPMDGASCGLTAPRTAPEPPAESPARSAIPCRL